MLSKSAQNPAESYGASSEQLEQDRTPMQWHAWKGYPCQRIFFHRAISSSFTNRPHDKGGGGGGDPCWPTSLASSPTYRPTSASTWPVDHTMHGVRTTEHDPRHHSCPGCCTLQSFQDSSRLCVCTVFTRYCEESGILAAVPPPHRPAIVRRLPVRVDHHHQGNATPALPQALTRRHSRRQRADRGGGLHGTDAVRFLSFGPGVSHLEKRPYARDLARSCSMLTYYFPNNAVLFVWQLATNLACTLHTGPGHSRTALVPVLPPCRPARLSCLFLARAYRTNSSPPYVLVLWSSCFF
ncbi:hypothetical protein QBC36DRAFT_350489 [Triangularia setosa]|uniref:Uncharacterized protein n=1 Tax=Triangularia setosa TaxID=2587417 RepID=A0AAN6VWU2_9PEZI|nr:hypothetical protein QBC36DRAFT_350489 [Podospora setosa]